MLLRSELKFLRMLQLIQLFRVQSQFVVLSVVMEKLFFDR